MNRKAAIVTGASRGIGRAIGEVFAREGARAVICGRRQETLDQVASEIGQSVMPIACHVGHADQIANMVATTERIFGPIDILVNNAATNISFGPCLEADEAQFDKMIEINLNSAFRLVKAIAPGMCSRGSGAIINITSIAGLRPERHSLLYSMTKAALIMMTQSYALELGPKRRTRELHCARFDSNLAQRALLEGGSAARRRAQQAAHSTPRAAIRRRGTCAAARL